jgi:hypothetical protein
MRAPGGSTFYQAPGCVRCFLDGGSVCLVNINGSTVTARIQAGDGPVSSFDYHAKCALLASCASTETDQQQAAERTDTIVKTRNADLRSLNRRKAKLKRSPKTAH